MVMVRLSAPLAEINGKGPGGIWRVDVCGQHLQKYPRPIPTRFSPEWRLHEDYFRFIWAEYHLHSWTTHERASWNTYANNHVITNLKGQPYTLSWTNAYMSVNLHRLAAGLIIIFTAPTSDIFA